jgi:Fe-S-cluster containining protein
MDTAPPPENNERAAICADCGGECCRNRPGIEAPDRFLAEPRPAEALASALASGDWVLLLHLGVPWVNGEPPRTEDRYRAILYPRPATVAERETGKVLCGAEPSPCVFLGTQGCALPFAGRPRMCQSLEPSASGECEGEWDQRSAALAWLPWQDLVAEAVRRSGKAGPGFGKCS